MPSGNPGEPRLYQRKRTQVICAFCQKVLERSPSLIRPKNFCNQTCFHRFSQGANHSCAETNKTSTQGYKVVGFGKNRHPEHRVIAEKVLGRTLKRNEVVHHIDGDKTNNKNSNLLICDVAYHQWLHMEMSRRYMQEHFGMKEN
jgi:hypothetical protein